MTKEIQLSSGRLLKIQLASFENANDMLGLVMQECKKDGIDLGDINSFSDFNEMEVSKLFQTLFSAVANLISSKEIRKQFFILASSCIYNNEKITSSTFESPEAREDYYDIYINIIKENIYPFLSKLPTILNNIFVKIKIKFQK